ncbi:MAG: hypothetical protein J3R72DRAFT_476225 [Linnemannia gamsii]|nr:MAG: hypothetical protein J3R72DRAFT_476225 [Linnemannia gamsii]
MSNTLPKFQEACLVSDTYSNSVIYLVGSSTDGILEVHSIPFNSLNSPVSTLFSQERSQQELPQTAWSPSLPKVCLPYPYESFTKGVNVTAVQLGAQNSLMAVFQPDGKDAKTAVIKEHIVSPKLFTLSVAYESSSVISEVFSIYTNTANNGAQWKGFGMNLTNPTVLSSPVKLDQVPLPGNPQFTIGTSVYGVTANFVVFDDQGKGTVFTTTSTNPFQGDKPLTLVKQSNIVNMNGFRLTKDAYPVRMGKIGYILDKSSSGVIVVYSISQDNTSNFTLNQVTTIGNGPSFPGFFTATHLNTWIVTYSLSDDGSPKLNAFNTQTGAWTGQGITSVKAEMSTLTLVLNIAGWLIAVLIIVFVLKKFWHCFEGCFCCLKGSRKNNGGGDGGGLLSVEGSPKPQHIPLEKVNQRPDPALPFPQHMATPYLGHTIPTLYPEHNNPSPFLDPSTAAPYPSHIAAPFPEHWPTQPPPSPMPSSSDQYTSSSPQYPPSPRLQPSPYP